MRRGVLATSVVRTWARSAARYRMSLITCGHASASTQIFIGSLLVAVQSPDSLFPSGHLRLMLPGENGHPHAHASQPSRHFARRVDPRVFAHRSHVVDLNFRPEGVVERKQQPKLLADGGLGEG